MLSTLLHFRQRNQRLNMSSLLLLSIRGLNCLMGTLGTHLGEVQMQKFHLYMATYSRREKILKVHPTLGLFMGLCQILLLMDQGNQLIESFIHQTSFKVCYSVRMSLCMLELCLNYLRLFLSPVSDSMECIEKDYVLVNARSSVIETFSYHLETSLQVNSTTRASTLAPKLNEQDVLDMQTAALAANSVGVTESLLNQGSVLLPTSSASTILREVQGLSILHPSTRLQLLHQYVQVLSELSQEKVCLLTVHIMESLSLLTVLNKSLFYLICTEFNILKLLFLLLAA